MSARNLRELPCRELVELVTEYLSHALSPEERVRFEQHLFLCPSCMTHLARVRSTIELVSRLRDDVATESVPTVLEGFRSWKRK